MWVVAFGFACVPHVDVGEIPIERASRPVRIATVDGSDRPTVVVVRVGLGSGDDPVGREGEAARLLGSLVSDSTIHVDVQPGASYFTCEGTNCSTRLERLVMGPGAAKSIRNMENPVTLAWRATVFAAHPLGRPVARTSVAPTLVDSEIASMYRRYFVRENLVVAVAGRDAASETSRLGGVFSRLSVALPPDRARVRPVPARGPRMATVEGASAWRLGQALDRSPSAEEAEALWVFGHLLGECERPTNDAPWFAVDGVHGWDAVWKTAMAEPSDTQVRAANAAAVARAGLDVALRWAVDDMAMGRAIRRPSEVSVSREAVVAAMRQYLSPQRWTVSVGDPRPESVRVAFLEGGPGWFVQPGIERPIATRMIAEELSR